jgi:uncharacterized 2Fe-2S/4Fe-4S cluster protein (DUF4445 family)
VNSETHLRVCSGDKTRTIHFSPEGQSLAQALAAGGFPLNTRCGERGLCHGCEVELSGENPRTVLACQHPVSSKDHFLITIPPRSLLSHRPSIVSDFRTGVPTGCDPLFSGAPLGLAVDIGTTTVALLLAELSTGDVLARATGLNQQVTRGDNVLTRIQLCQDNKANIATLQADFWERTFRPLMKQVLKASGQTEGDVAGVVLAGNTTMLHLACGVDPTPLGTVPFQPGFLEPRSIPGSEFGLAPAWSVHTLPGLSAYVGADITAGAVCCGLAYAKDAGLLVDVGTNGEILLCGPMGHFACATAAGPAFEGCGLLCGMRAAEGVVSRISLSGAPLQASMETIGGSSAQPHGITGSAYVDFLFEGRKAGLLTENGRFDPVFIGKYPEHFRREENGWSFLLTPPNPTLRIGEVDVALLLQAKAAIAAGIETVLAKSGLGACQIGTVFLAGGFGLHLSIPHAIGCGLLPGFQSAQISAVGNTSLGGAYLAMLDQSLIQEMSGLAVEILELNLEPGFEDRFLDHLALPCPKL